MALKNMLRTVERAAVEQALLASDWSLRKAARLLGIPCSSLQTILGRHRDLDRKRRRLQEHAAA